MPSGNTYVLLGFLLPRTWGISSRLLQQSTAAAPYLGRGVSSHSHPSWPWMWRSCLSPPAPRSSRSLEVGLLLSATAPALRRVVAPLDCRLNQIPYEYTVEVRNWFKGLGLIGREPDELWMEVHLQKTEIKTIPMEKKCKKAKWLSEADLQIAVKREAKSKGEKERYSHLNAEFQRIARRDKKAFLSNQCK